MEFTEAQWAGLTEHAEERGLIFLSSPFSIEAVELLDRVGRGRLEGRSGEVSTRRCSTAGTGMPVLLSTGMSPLAEIDARGAPAAAGLCRAPPVHLALPIPARDASASTCWPIPASATLPRGLSDHSGTIFPAWRRRRSARM